MSDSVKTVSETFNAPDGDLTIESCDNVLFHVHRKYLEAHSGAFPPSEFKSTKGEILSLTEDSHTLTMLFQYVYPRRNPDIELLTFDPFYKLAEAAEKYQVFSPMDSCKLRVRHFLASNPAQILAYAHKHDYPDILDEAVHYLLDLPVHEAMNILPPHLGVSWARYQDVWSTAVCKVVTAKQCVGCLRKQNTLGYYHGVEPDACARWVNLGHKRSPKGVKAAFAHYTYEELCNVSKCQYCHSMLTVDSAFIDIGKFTSFL